MAKVLETNTDFPIKTDEPVHFGKVRAVYWLTTEDSARLIKEKGYDVAADADLAVMVISDRISAYEIVWKGEGGMNGVPGKGAALNAISNHWFKLFKEKGLADSHILDIPHPLVWIVQKARPVMIEAIARQYITGSMWRDYSKGSREFCGITIPDGLKNNQKLDKLLITPSTKGILKGIPGVPEIDDVNISRTDITSNLDAFNFKTREHVDDYEKLLTEGFDVISDFAGLHWLLRTSMRSGFRAKLIEAELTEIRFHPPFVAPMLAALESGRRTVEPDAACRLPTLEALRWRLDVAISTASLNKVLRPHLTLQCTLSDDSQHSFHVSRERFDELRYTVAKLLTEMQALENRLPPMQESGA